jgi:fructokinase
MSPDRPEADGRDRADQDAGQRPGRPGSLLEPPVLAWLSGALPGDRVAAAAPLSGGYGNENILVTTGRGRCVLRRYRRGGSRDAARTCAVEAALASRLAGTPVPVPEVIAADPAGSVTGEPLLLTRYVAGLTVAAAIGRDSGPESGPAAQAMTRAGDGAGRRPARATAEPDRSQAAQIGAAAGRALAAVGMVTFERGGVFTGADLVPSEAGWPDSLPEFVENCVRAGPAATALSGAELRQLRALAVRSDPLARRVASSRQLVHSDYNGKNLLAVRRDGQWSISAVLDWEFAFSGSPLTDIGNMLRFGEEYPPGFAGSFIAGYQEAGGHLPPDWREISAALDLYALADFLTRPPGHRYFGKAVAAIRKRLAPR